MPEGANDRRVRIPPRAARVAARAGRSRARATAALRLPARRPRPPVAMIGRRGFLSADQQWRVSELKKLKLIAKDRMEAILRQARAAAHA